MGGAATIGGTLVQTLTGTITPISDGIEVDSKVKADTLDVESGVLNVAGGLTLNADLLVHGTGGGTGIAISGGLTGSGTADIAGGMTVAGSVVSTTLTGNAMTIADAGIYAGANSEANSVTVSNDMFVAGGTTVTSAVVITGGMTIPDLLTVASIAQDSTNSNSFNLQVTNGLTVTGGNFNIDDGKFQVNGAVTAKSLSVGDTGDCGATHNFDVKAITNAKVLKVYGDMRLTGDLHWLTATSSQYVENDLEFTSWAFPTGQPTGQPSAQPTTIPSGEPTAQPTGQPTAKPSTIPSGEPTGEPTGERTGEPTGEPTGAPTSAPQGARRLKEEDEEVKDKGGSPAGIIEGQAEFLHNNEVSDIRLKRNITALTPQSALEAVRSVDPLLFRYNGIEIQHLHSNSKTTPNPAIHRYGVMAQDLQKKLPELVDIIGTSSLSSTPSSASTEHEQGTLKNIKVEEEDSSLTSSSFNSTLTPVYGVRYTSLIPVVTEALKGIMTRIDNCTTDRQELHANMTRTLDLLEDQAASLKTLMEDTDLYHRSIIERNERLHFL